MYRLAAVVVVNFLLLGLWLIAMGHYVADVFHSNRWSLRYVILAIVVASQIILPFIVYLHFALPAWVSGGEMLGGLPGLSCTPAGIAALYNGTAGNIGAPSVIPFTSFCGAGEVELVGYTNATAGTKCCVPALRGRFTCNGFALVPNLVSQADLLFDNVTLSSYSSCCPSLFADITPAGFASMSISATVGVLINLILNALMMLWGALKKSSARPETSEVLKIKTSSDFRENVTPFTETGGCMENGADANTRPVAEHKAATTPGVQEATTTAAPLDAIRCVFTGSRGNMACSLSPSGLRLALGKFMVLSVHPFGAAQECPQNSDDAPPLFEVDLSDCCAENSALSAKEGSSQQQDEFSCPAIGDCCFTPDGSEIICVERVTAAIYVVDVTSHAITFYVPPTTNHDHDAVNPDIDEKEEINNDIVRISDDSLSIATCGEGVHVWRRDHRDAPFKFVTFDNLVARSVTTCAFLRNRSTHLVAITDDHKVVSFDLVTHQLTVIAEQPVRAAMGRFLVQFHGFINIFVRGPVKRRLHVVQSRDHIVVSPDGAAIAWKLSDELSVCLTSKTDIRSSRHSTGTRALAFTPDSRAVVECNSFGYTVWGLMPDGVSLYERATVSMVSQLFTKTSAIFFPPGGDLMVTVNLKMMSPYLRGLEAVPFLRSGVQVHVVEISNDMARLRADKAIAFNTFLADLFGLSTLTKIKFAAGAVGGLVGAVLIDSGTAKVYYGSWMPSFSLAVVNGPVLASFVDIVSTVAITRTIRACDAYPTAWFSYPPSEGCCGCTAADRLTFFLSLLDKVKHGITLVFALAGHLMMCVAFSTFLILHMPGVFVLFPAMLPFLSPFLMAIAASSLLLVARPEDFATNTRRYAVRLVAVLTTAVCAVSVNIFLLVILRFPVNFFAIVLGKTSYPYLPSEAYDDWTYMYNGLYGTSFYMLQISSATCASLRSAESTAAYVSNVLTLL